MVASLDLLGAEETVRCHDDLFHMVAELHGTNVEYSGEFVLKEGDRPLGEEGAAVATPLLDASSSLAQSHDRSLKCKLHLITSLR